MPKPHQKTRSKKRKLQKLPGKQTTTHYKNEKIGITRCARCGRNLYSIPALPPYKLGKLAATQKRVQRLYGGQLCHMCLREALKQTVRSGL